MAYLENVPTLKKNFKISGKKFDFTRLSILKKHIYLSEYSTFRHKNKPYIQKFDDLYSIFFRPYTIVLKDSNIKIKVFKKTEFTNYQFQDFFMIEDKQIFLKI